MCVHDTWGGWIILFERIFFRFLLIAVLLKYWTILFWEQIIQQLILHFILSTVKKLRVFCSFF